MTTLEEIKIKEKVAELRVKWKAERDPIMREIIKRRALALQYSLGNEKPATIKEAKEIFGIK